MAKSTIISEPLQLWEMPTPADPVIGKIWVGPSFSFKNSRRRRRIEVIVGIDGECIQIHSLKFPNRIASHSLPPQVSLTAPPCCVVDKSDSDTLRCIYAPVKNKTGRNKSQLLCFRLATRFTVQDKGQRHSAISESYESYDACDIDGEIVHIEPIITRQRKCHEIIIVQDDCQIACVTAGIRHLKWKSRLELFNSPHNAPMKTDRVDYVAFLKMEQAQKFLFRNRTDISQPDGTTSDQMFTSRVIFLITSSNNEPKEQVQTLHLLLFRVYPDSGPTHIQSLANWPLPLEVGATSGGRRRFDYSFDLNSGFLYQSSENRIMIFEFSRSSPRIISMFAFQEVGPLSLIPLPKCHFLVQSNGSCCIYNARYRSLQGSQRLSSPKPATEHAVDSIEKSTFDALTLYSYFPSQRLVLGISGRKMLSFRVVLPNNKTHDDSISHLVNSLGRSVRSSELTLSALRLHQDENDAHVTTGNDDLNRFENALDLALAKDNMAMFKHLLDDASNRKLILLPRRNGIARDAVSVAVFANYSNSESCLHNGRCLMQLSVRQFGALFALGWIFDWNDNENLDNSCPVVVRALPLQIFRWIVSESFLTAENVEYGLTLRKPLHQMTRSIESQNIVKAIAIFDTSLQTLLPLTTKLALLNLTGLIELIDHLVQSLDMMAISNAYQSAHTDQSSFLENAILAEQEAAVHDLDVATAYLDAGITIRALSLRNCLESLGLTFSEHRIIQALRSQLSTRKIMFIIDILRVELEQNGWTSCRLDRENVAEDAPEGQEEALFIICKVLNCALDAIGTGGWFHSHMITSKTLSYTPISTLSDVTTATLEGVQDSVFFAGFLKDFLRLETFVLNSGQLNRQHGGMLRTHTKRRDICRGKFEPGHVFRSKCRRFVPSMRTMAGGEIRKRRSREMGERMSHLHNRYTYEALRF